jgi:hypothetical protein
MNSETAHYSTTYKCDTNPISFRKAVNIIDEMHHSKLSNIETALTKYHGFLSNLLSQIFNIPSPDTQHVEDK